MTDATEIQAYLKQLHAERALAAIDGQAAYLDDLDAEIVMAGEAYVAAAVTEIAMLRGELYGRPQG